MCFETWRDLGFMDFPQVTEVGGFSHFILSCPTPLPSYPNDTKRNVVIITSTRRRNVKLRNDQLEVLMLFVRKNHSTLEDLIVFFFTKLPGEKFIECVLNLQHRSGFIKHWMLINFGIDRMEELSSMYSGHHQCCCTV